MAAAQLRRWHDGWTRKLIFASLDTRGRMVSGTRAARGSPPNVLCIGGTEVCIRIRVSIRVYAWMFGASCPCRTAAAYLVERVGRAGLGCVTCVHMVTALECGGSKMPRADGAKPLFHARVSLGAISFRRLSQDTRRSHAHLAFCSQSRGVCERCAVVIRTPVLSRL